MNLYVQNDFLNKNYLFSLIEIYHKRTDIFRETNLYRNKIKTKK